MLNKEDYLRYLEQMQAIEARMIRVYSDCFELAGDKELKDSFTNLMEAEDKHFRLIDSLKELF